MAPNLAASQHQLIGDMILSKSLKQAGIAAAAGCSERAIRRIVSNLRYLTIRKHHRTVLDDDDNDNDNDDKLPLKCSMLFGSTCLLAKPGSYQDEMAAFYTTNLAFMSQRQSISRALASVGWSKKTTHHVAKERNADLRDFYLYNLSEFRSYHLVYLDESGCDKRIGFRHTGWPHSVQHLCRLLNSTEIVGIGFYRRIRKIAFSYLGVFKELLTLHYMRSSLNSFLTIAGDGQSPILCLSWIMLHFIKASEFSRCALTQALSCCIYRLTRQT
jgi:hypothetical protein